MRRAGDSNLKATGRLQLLRMGTRREVGLAGRAGSCWSIPVFFGFLPFSLAWLDMADTLPTVTGVLFAYLRGNSKKSRSMQAEVARRTPWNGIGVPGEAKA